MNTQWKSQLKNIGLSCIILLAVAAPARTEQYGLDKSIMRDSGASKKNESVSGTINNFSDSYKRRNRPKIAVFLNRTLSDDVREWRTDKRSVVIGTGTITTSTESALRYREETAQGPAAAYEQLDNGVEAARANASEPYMWAFEDGFMQPFLKAGATLVDRATILRLMSRTSDQGTATDVIETKKNEMNALLNNADIFIELLVTRYPSAPTGYEFRAVAKEVKTGRIIGSATSLNWDTEGERPKKIVTTETGYKVIDDPKMPKVQHVSKDLAVDLMNSIIGIWSTN